MLQDTDYAYAVARIRAIEKKLLDKNNFERMAEAKSPEDALKIVFDAGYGAVGADMSNPLEYENLLKDEQRKAYALLRETSPNPAIFDIFFLRDDYHNIKVIIKGEFSDGYDDGILSGSGTIPANKIKLMLRERSFADMPPEMRRAVEECLDVFNRTGDPQMIDFILDKACFAQMKELASKTGNAFLIGLTVILIDIANIKSFLRVKRLGRAWDLLGKAFIPGGMLDKKLFEECLNEPIENFEAALNLKPYSTLAVGIDTFKNAGSFSKFEQLADNHILSYARKALYKPMGPEPLIGYLIGKENEIKNIRIIMVGKINGIPADAIKDRLRDSYA